MSKVREAKKLLKKIQDAKPKYTHYSCPCCIYSTWTKNEDFEGEALQNIKDHLRSFHGTHSMDHKIKEK